jgi:hypothetical protein
LLLGLGELRPASSCLCSLHWTGIALLLVQCSIGRLALATRLVGAMQGPRRVCLPVCCAYPVHAREVLPACVHAAITGGLALVMLGGDVTLWWHMSRRCAW